MGNHEEPAYKRFEGTCRTCGKTFIYHNSVKRHPDHQECPQCEAEKIEWQELLEWSGFRRPTQEEARIARDVNEWWWYPDGDIFIVLPDLDLNNLFKWVVSKLVEIGYEITVRCFSGKWDVSLFAARQPFPDIDIKCIEDPKQALFQACYKVMKKVRDE